MQIYIAKSGQQTGPFSTEQLKSMLNARMIALDDSAWHEGLSAWQPLHQVLNVAPPIPQPPGSYHNANTSGTNSGAMFLYIPTARLIVMSIVSLGLYDAYWMYRNWRYLKERDGLKIQPFWRGVFGLFFIHSLLTSIKNDPTTSHIKTPTFSINLAVGWIMLSLRSFFWGVSGDPGMVLIGNILGMLSFFFLLPVQKHINALNDASPQRPEYYPFSGGHIVCLVLGIIFWLLILFGAAA